MEQAVTEEKKKDLAVEAPASPAAMAMDKTTATAQKQKPKEDIHDKKHKTTGEKAYDWIQFLVGKAWIMFFTAVIAFSAKYGKDHWNIGGELKVPNFIKAFNDWCIKTVRDPAIETSIAMKTLAQEQEKLKPILGEANAKRLGWISSKLHSWVLVFGASFANTMVLFHGGNLFSPVMKWIENSKEKISTWVNKRWGKEGEVELGHERLKDEPQQTWGDIIKGRLVAWMIVFTSFSAACVLIGKRKKNGKEIDYWFNEFEEGVGRVLTKWFGKGEAKEIAKTSLKIPFSEMSKEHQEVLSKDFWHRFGKITGLDVFATTMAILIWNAVSRFSAKKKRHSSPDATAVTATSGGTNEDKSDLRPFTPKEKSEESEKASSVDNSPPTEAELAEHDKQRKRFLEKTTAPAASHVAATQKPEVPEAAAAQR